MTREEAIQMIQNDMKLHHDYLSGDYRKALRMAISALQQPEIIHCWECKHWRQQTNYAGTPLSFGFCESDDMWRSLYGEITEVSHIDTDYDFYCGYAERQEE